MSASAILVLALAFIAGMVAAMQWINGRKNQSVMWAQIVTYWCVLTVKNVFDLLGW